MALETETLIRKNKTSNLFLVPTSKERPSGLTTRKMGSLKDSVNRDVT